MKRLAVSLLGGLIGWFALAAVLMEVCIPATCKGCEDDLGAGLVAVIISAGSFALAALGVLLCNAVYSFRHRPKRS
ncbi:hypothetical protein [Roseateles sp.]|uniref:hypothetical protein n=1 Tax=Roseateles sp. TaxID=1971397 RepID=UPI0039EBE3A7